MKNKELKWKPQTQEVKGNYTFSGRVKTTKRISEELDFAEIISIIITVRKEAMKQKGLDYLLVLKNNTGQKLFVIDNLSKEMKEDSSPVFLLDNNYFTILFAEEY